MWRMQNAASYRLQVVVVAAGPYLYAMARVGGLVVRGRMMNDPGSALRALFQELAAPGSNQDALLAVEMMAAGEDMRDVAADTRDLLELSGREADRVLTRRTLPPATRPPALSAAEQQEGDPERGHDQERAPGDLAG